MSGPLPDPYGAVVRRRYLHQMLVFAPALRRWRRQLLALRQGPVPSPLAPTLRWAYDRVPFWQQRFRALGVGRHELADPAIFAALPPTTRADLQAHFHDLCARGISSAERADAYDGRTSGSTGEPIRYRMSGAAYHSFLALVDLALKLFGAPRRPRPGGGGIALLDALGHSPEYGAWLPLFHGTRFAKITIDRPGWRDRLRALDPAVITGDPDSLAALLDAPVDPGLVMSSAFAMPPGRAEALRAALGCPVVEYYSAQEIGPMALALPGDDLAVLTPFVHLEAAPLADGGTQLLVTDLRNPLMPLIRYAIGDLGRISPTRGGLLHAPRLSDFTGRVPQRFARPGGGAFDPAGLAPSLARLPIEQYRLSQTATDRATLEYLAARPLTEAETGALTGRLSALADAPMHLTARRVFAPLNAPGVKPRPFVPLGAAFDVRAQQNHDAPVAGRPHRVYVAVTNACNRACPWCSTFSSPERRTWLSLDAFAAALPAEGDFELQLEGGEPTLHPELHRFIDLARATGRCRHSILCTNGVRLPRRPDALRAWLARWPRPLTIKVSANHHLIERDATHLDRLRALADVAPGEGVEVVINLRRRRAGDGDQWVRAAVEAAGLMPLTNDFFLQRYGLAADDDTLDPPYLAGTDFTLINPDGAAFGTDLVARSDAM
ncbi:MAG: hypothetical protein KC620_07265, partial [Myxococcales bacterium]|nr:hypothetical protein [Myxococcales bacterium]